MTEDEVIQRFGLPPRLGDLPAIRAELDASCARERAVGSDTLTMKALCVVLFAAADVEDSLRIWTAKRTTFDAGCSVDVQLLCGAGFGKTVDHLRSVDSEDARAALDYILKCDAAGDFDGHDGPGGRLAHALAEYREYYGLTG